MTSLPTLSAAERKFSFLSTCLKYVRPKIWSVWQLPKEESRDIQAKAGGVWTSELKCYLLEASVVDCEYGYGSSMTE